VGRFYWRKMFLKMKGIYLDNITKELLIKDPSFTKAVLAYN